MLSLRNQVALGAVAIGALTFTASSGAVLTKTYSNPTPIAIPDVGPAAPSTVQVSNPGFQLLPGTRFTVSLTLLEITHSSVADLDVSLISPSGGTARILENVGGNNPVNGVTWTLGDVGPRLSGIFPSPSGTYVPSAYALDGGLSGAQSPGFLLTRSPGGGASVPVGAWTLNVTDNEATDSGVIAGGWSLQFSGTPSNVGTLGKVKRNQKKGTARVSVSVPNPGVIEIAKKPTVRGFKLNAPVAGTYNLTVKARGKASKKLKAKHRVSVPLRVDYTPTGGTRKSLSKSVVLKKK
jgi:subtilisin-like proprotein convertase family protein